MPSWQPELALPVPAWGRGFAHAGVVPAPGWAGAGSPVNLIHLNPAWAVGFRGRSGQVAPRGAPRSAFNAIYGWALDALDALLACGPAPTRPVAACVLVRHQWRSAPLHVGGCACL